MSGYSFIYKQNDVLPVIQACKFLEDYGFEKKICEEIYCCFLIQYENDLLKIRIYMGNSRIENYFGEEYVSVIYKSGRSYDVSMMCPGETQYLPSSRPCERVMMLLRLLRKNMEKLETEDYCLLQYRKAAVYMQEYKENFSCESRQYLNQWRGEIVNNLSARKFRGGFFNISEYGGHYFVDYPYQSGFDIQIDIFEVTKSLAQRLEEDSHLAGKLCGRMNCIPYYITCEELPWVLTEENITKPPINLKYSD